MLGRRLPPARGVHEDNGKDIHHGGLTAVLVGCSLNIRPLKTFTAHGHMSRCSWRRAEITGDDAGQAGTVSASVVHHIGGDACEVSAYTDVQNGFGGGLVVPMSHLASPGLREMAARGRR